MEHDYCLDVIHATQSMQELTIIFLELCVIKTTKLIVYIFHIYVFSTTIVLLLVFEHLSYILFHNENFYFGYCNIIS